MLVYQLFAVDRLHIGLRCYSLDIRKGDRWVGTPYPLRTDSVMSGKVQGIRVTGLDQKILMSMQMHQKIRGDDNLFQGVDTSRMVESLIKTGRAYTMGKNPPPISFVEPVEREFMWTVQEEGFQLDLRLEPAERLIPGKPCYLLHTETGDCAKLKSRFSDAVVWKWVTHRLIPHGEQIAAWEKLVAEFPGVSFPPPPDTQTQKVPAQKPTPVFEFVKADPVTRIPDTVRISFLYGNSNVVADTPGEDLRWVEGNVIVESKRLPLEEKKYVHALQNMGFTPYEMNADSIFAAALKEQRYVPDLTKFPNWKSLIPRVVPELEQAGWHLEVPDEFVPVVVADSDWYSGFKETGSDLLRYEQGIVVDGKRVNLLPLLHGFLKERRGLTLEQILEEIGEERIPVSSVHGLLMLNGLRFQKMLKTLFELFGDGVLDKEGHLRINSWRAAELHDEHSEGWAPPPELVQAMEVLRGGISIHALEPPSEFKGELREYQKRGLGWIDFLSEFHLGGILADDMGLGKTVQVIAAFLRMRELRTSPCQFLVVCPASVLPNWRAELKRFSPSLAVHSHHGLERHQEPEALQSAEVILTTYATLQRDKGTFCEMKFTAVVLDEAQAIKNRKTKISKMVGNLQADLRLALSGTPLENHVGELRALFQFVMPGYLGSEKMFNQAIRRPIEKENSELAKKVLHEKISSLMLRRSKDLVAGELPPKTEIVQEISLSPLQMDLYEVVRVSGQQQIRETIQEQGFERSQIQVLDLLTKLRQVCNDPRSCKKVDSKSGPEDSAKLVWLRDALPEMVEEGRRILLFSQFTSMLDLIKPEVERMKIPYVEIRGSTRDREKPVLDFQQGNVPLFLISLKAGGTGLNLTAADTVIFFDPWWNPAVEAQAADRAHRIGQDKPVFVYKLICAGTVESRILEMQQRKKDLQGLLDAKAKGSAERFTEDDFKTLMAPLSE